MGRALRRLAATTLLATTLPTSARARETVKAVRSVASCLCVQPDAIRLRLVRSTTSLGMLLAGPYVSSFGVGFPVRAQPDSSQEPKILALIFALATVAILLNSLVRRIERRATAHEH